MQKKIQAIVLFSGGLDSILAAKLLQAQGLSVLCLHFTSPFFGKPEAAARWRELYDLDIECRDISLPFVKMLATGPANGYGKNLNPCVDCKILQMREAAKVMREIGANFLASGEVVGQRPMSQRRDCLNLIQKRAEVAGLLLRPLSAQLLDITDPEKNGLVNRAKLLAISGRGRSMQLKLAQEFGLRHIPTPAGGCRLTEIENMRRYWQVLKYRDKSNMASLTADFELADIGRQFWHFADGRHYWLAMGRKCQDNEMLLARARADDMVIRLGNLPGPVAVAREGLFWPRSILEQAAAHTAAFSGKAVNAGGLVSMRLYCPEKEMTLAVAPKKLPEVWNLPTWESAREEIAGAGKKGPTENADR